MTRHARKGLSLIEVVIIVAILALLVGFLLPATRRTSNGYARMKCQNNMKQIMLATLDFEATQSPKSDSDTAHHNMYPPGCVGRGSTPDERLSWMVTILPFMEQEWLYKKFDMKEGYEGNLSAGKTSMNFYHCPSSKIKNADFVTHYVALAGIGPNAAKHPANTVGNGFMGYDRLTSSASIKDGTSNTIALMETQTNVGPWARGGFSTLRGYDPDDLPLIGEGRPFASGHTGIMVVAMADGSVRSTRGSIDPKILAAAITIAGDEKFEWE